MPLSISRLANFVGRDWGQTILFVGASLYACGGFCNAILYTATRRGLISWSWCGWRRKFQKPSTSPFASPTIPEEKFPAAIPRLPIDPGDSTSVLDSGGQDFRNSAAFDKLDVLEDLDRVHEKYCNYNSMDEGEGSSNGSTAVCTCKTPPKYQTGSED